MSHNFSQQQHVNIPHLRIAVVGDSGVGKSTILRKLCYSKPDPGHFFDFGANIEMCYHIAPANLFQNLTQFTSNSNFQPPSTNSPTDQYDIYPDHRLVIVEFIELPGHKRYKETRETLLNGIDGVLLFFDARHERSQKSVPNWYDELLFLHQQRSCFATSINSTPQHSTQSFNPQFPSQTNTYPHTTLPNSSLHPLDQQNNLNHTPSNRPFDQFTQPTSSQSQSSPFPLFLIGTVINSLQPFHFPWIDEIPFEDLAYVDINSLEEFIFQSDDPELDLPPTPSSPPGFNSLRNTENNGTDDFNQGILEANQQNNSNLNSLFPFLPSTQPPSTTPQMILSDPNSHPFLILEALIGRFIDSLIEIKFSPSTNNTPSASSSASTSSSIPSSHSIPYSTFASSSSNSNHTHQHNNHIDRHHIGGFNRNNNNINTIDELDGSDDEFASKYL